MASAIGAKWRATVAQMSPNLWSDRNVRGVEKNMEPRETKVDLGSLGDETLVLHVRQGSEEAARVLYERYWPLAVRRAHRAEEARSALTHALYSCVVRVGYDPSRGKPLRPYLMKAFEHALVSEYRASTWRRARSLDDPDAAGSPDVLQRVATPAPELPGGPCTDAVVQLLDTWEAEPSGRGDRRLWAEVLRRTCDGETPADIAAELGMSAPAVSRLLSKRIRPAVKSALERASECDSTTQADGGVTRS